MDTSHGNEVLSEDLAHLIQDHVTNGEVHNKFQQTIGPYQRPDSDNSQERQTEVVQPHLMITWPHKKHLTRYHERVKKQEKRWEDIKWLSGSQDIVQTNIP